MEAKYTKRFAAIEDNQNTTKEMVSRVDKQCQDLKETFVATEATNGALLKEILRRMGPEGSPSASSPAPPALSSNTQSWAPPVAGLSQSPDAHLANADEEDLLWNDPAPTDGEAME